MPKFIKFPPWGGRKDTPTKYDDGGFLEKQVKEESKSALEVIIQEGARRLLQEAIKNEVTEYINRLRIHEILRGGAWL